MTANCRDTFPVAVPVCPDASPTTWSPADRHQLWPYSLSPTDIEIFINNTQDVDLTKIWQSLGIKDNSGPDAITKCANCKAETFFYNLDDDFGDEAILKVADHSREAARFVVFKAVDPPDKWKVLGHADFWGKYIEPYPMMLLSGGKAWLVIRGQGASGSGVALYNDYIFQVSGGRLRQIAGYSAEGYQSGLANDAIREFIARPVSCEVSRGRALVELDLKVAYSIYDSENQTYPTLFTKRQHATLVKKLKSNSRVLDSGRSDLSQAEFESVYNVDSLYIEDFVKYNFAELSAIASGGNRVQKEWLRDYLKTCESTTEVRKLERMLTE